MDRHSSQIFGSQNILIFVFWCSQTQIQDNEIKEIQKADKIPVPNFEG